MSPVAAYRKNAAAALDPNELVTTHAVLVKRIAYHLMSRLPPSVQVDDLIQAGMIGLLEAARNYDASQGASFETYAGIRIRGAMLDEIRKGDWAPRSLHRKMREVTRAMREIEAEKGRDAKDAEVAERIGVTLEEYYRILQDAVTQKVFSLDEMPNKDQVMTEGMSGGTPEPTEEVERMEFKEALAAAVATLPERERLVLALYYQEDLNLRETGEVLGVSESRVCQIHGQALLRLRARVAEWYE